MEKLNENQPVSQRVQKATFFFIKKRVKKLSKNCPFFSQKIKKKINLLIHNHTKRFKDIALLKINGLFRVQDFSLFKNISNTRNECIQ